MFEDQQQDPQPPARPSGLRRAAVATALVVGVVAGGYGVAAAQSDETPTTEETPSTTAPDDTPSTTAPDDGTTTQDRGPGCDRDGDGTPDAEASGSSADASL